MTSGKPLGNILSASDLVWLVYFVVEADFAAKFLGSKWMCQNDS